MYIFVSNVIKKLSIICFTPILLLNLGCREQREHVNLRVSEVPSVSVQGDAQGLIYTSTWILKDLTSSALEDSTRVNLLTPPDRDPAHYTPSVQTLSRLQEAQLIILNGARLETGLDAVSLPLSRTLKSARGFRDQWMRYPKHLSEATHHHGPEGAHNHQGVDGHTWLDPILLRRQLSAIISRLELLRLPISKERLRHVDQQLKRIDTQWRTLAPLLRARATVSNHPAYQYVSRRYQLSVEPLDLSPETPPSNEQLNALRRALARRAELRPLMLWESAPSLEVRLKLEPLKITHVVISTLEQRPQRLSTAHTSPTRSAALEIYERELDALRAALDERLDDRLSERLNESARSPQVERGDP